MTPSAEVPPIPIADSSLPLDGGLFEGESCAQFEREILPAYVLRSRWFGGKARGPQRFSVSENLPLAGMHFLFVDVTYANGAVETSQLVLTFLQGSAARQMRAENPQAVLCQGDGGEAVLCDALYSGAARAAIYEILATAGSTPGRAGHLVGTPGAALDRAARPEGRLLKVEQSNSSIIYGDRIFLKLYRRIEEGTNPDAEITRFLSEKQGFQNVPPFAGELSYEREGSEPRVLALALGLVPNRGDAWSWALEQVASFYERVPRGAAPSHAPALLHSQPLSPEITELVSGEFLARAQQLGTRTGEMHRALAADGDDPNFASEPFTHPQLNALAERIRTSASALLPALQGRPLDAAMQMLQSCVPLIEARAAELASAPVRAQQTRTHGDYHLGQVLETSGDFTIIDFEGEPARSLSERREKRSPLRDVAGMLRSFHYAAHAGLVGRTERAVLEPWAEFWAQSATSAFLRGWQEATRGAAFLPENPTELTRLLEAFLLEKAIYEVSYELNNRPDWLPIPVRGLHQLLQLASSGN